MRATVLGLAAAMLALPALADDPFGSPVGADTLGAQRGGTLITDNVLQGNTTDQTANNSMGNVDIGGAKLSGYISPATIAGNSGITTVMQNTGDMVSVSNATNVNVYLH